MNQKNNVKAGKFLEKKDSFNVSGLVYMIYYIHHENKVLNWIKNYLLEGFLKIWFRCLNDYHKGLSNIHSWHNLENYNKFWVILVLWWNNPHEEIYACHRRKSFWISRQRSSLFDQSQPSIYVCLHVLTGSALVFE